MLVDPGVLSEIYGEKKKTFEDLLFLFSLPAGGNIVYAALPVLQSKKRVHWKSAIHFVFDCSTSCFIFLIIII